MVRQVDTEQREFILKRIFRNFIGRRRKEQEPEKEDEVKTLLQEVCDEEFLKQSEKLRGKRKRMLFWLGEFNPPKRLMAQYERYSNSQSSAAFSHQRAQTKAKKHWDNALEAGTRSPYGFFNHLYNQSEAKSYLDLSNSASSEAHLQKLKSDEYRELVENIENEIHLYKLEVERLKKLLETVEDVEEGLKIERVLEKLENELSYFNNKKIKKDAEESRKHRKENRPTMKERMALILKVQSKEELEKVYGSSDFQGIRFARGVFNKYGKIKDELKFYENSIAKAEENLKKVRTKIQELKKIQENRPLNYQEFKLLKELTEKEARIAGGNEVDRCIIEIIKLEQRYSTQ